MTDSDLHEIEVKAMLEQEAEMAERKRLRAIKIEQDRLKAAAKPPQEFPEELPDLNDVSELLKAADPITIKMLYKMMYNEETPAATRARIAEILLSYSRGKPVQEGAKKDKDDKPTTKIGIVKEKILKAIPNEQLDALLSELHEAGLDSGEEETNVQQD